MTMKIQSLYSKVYIAIVAILACLGLSVVLAPATQAAPIPPHTIVAQDITEGDPNCPQGDAPAKGQGANCVIKHIIRPILAFLTAVAGVFIVIQIIIGGIQYSSAGGDPGKVAAARGRIMNAVFTLLAFIFLWAFLQYIIPGGFGN